MIIPADCMVKSMSVGMFGKYLDVTIGFKTEEDATYWKLKLS